MAKRGSSADGEAAVPDRALRRVRAINEYLEAGVKIGLIAVGIFAGLQYCSSVDTQRAKQVLDYAHEFDSEALLVAQRRIDRELVAMARRIDQANGNRAQSIAREEAAMVDRLRNDVAVDGLGSDIALVVGFMDKVEACQRNGVCDAGLVKEFFKPYAAGLAAALQCHLRVERRRREGYGDGLLAIAEIPTLESEAARRCPGG